MKRIKIGNKVGWSISDVYLSLCIVIIVNGILVNKVKLCMIFLIDRYDDFDIWIYLCSNYIMKFLLKVLE